MKKKEEDKKNKEKNETEENKDKVNKKEIIEVKKNNNEDNNNKDYSCVLKWKGIIKKKNFYHFQVLIKKNYQELLEFFEDNNLIHLNNNIN